jgi:hypothetical protein
MNKKQDILREAIDENMNKEIGKIPEEKIVKEVHILSEEVEKEIEKLRDNRYSKNRKESVWKKKWWYLATPIAAGFILIFAMLWKPYQMNQSKSHLDSLQTELAIYREEAASPSNIAENKEENIGYLKETKEITETIVTMEAVETGKNQNISLLFEVKADKEEYKAKDIIKLTILNYMQEEIGYEEAVSLEIEKEGKWETVPLTKEHEGFKEFWNIIEVGGSSVSQVDLDIFEIKEVNENYRLLKSINGEEIEVYFRISR